MKILYAVSSLRKGGPVNQLYGLVRHLDRREFDPAIVILSRDGGNSRRSDFLELGVEVFDAALRPVNFSLCRARGLKEAAEKHSPDIIHSHGIRADFLSAFFWGGFPRVSTVHNFPFEDYRFTYGKMPGYLTAASHVKILSRLDAVVACSESVSSRFREECPGFPVRYIRNGVDCESYRPAEADVKSALRKKLNIPSGAVVFLSAGHLSERKDPLTLIRAFKKCGGRDCLVMLGRGPLREKCLKEARGSGNIRFAGRVDNAAEYMRAADIFVSCSRAEGLPTAVLEACSSGLFCVLSDIAPHAEIAGLAPGASVLFKTGDPESLESAFRGADILMKNFDSGLYPAGRFCDGRMSSEYRRLYYGLAGKGASDEN